MLKKLSVIFISVLFLTLTACTQNQTTGNSYHLSDDLSVYETAEIDNNDNFSLGWNKQQNCVLLTDLRSGAVWASTPKDVWKNGGSSSISSAIAIEYYNSSTGVLEEAKSYECSEEQTISVTVKDKVLHTEFYFDAAGIMIPVEYRLNEKGLNANIDVKDITEKKDVKLIKISFLPYMCSVANSEDENNYLMAPIGSGALIYPKADKQDISRHLTLPFYGGDKSQKNVEYATQDVTVNMPVYGAKSGKNGLFSVIKSGASSADLHIESGNNRTGHSAVYPIFKVRGYDIDEVEVSNWADDNIYNNNICKNLVISVDYYPLTNENATYSGMANFYRDNILKINSNNNSGSAPYNISIIGGFTTKSFVLGIPTYKFSSVTTFEQSKKVIEELSKSTGSYPQVNLYGFGTSGIDVGKIAGGYKYSSKLGGNKGALKFNKWCEEKKINMFFDFRMMTFAGGGLIGANKIAKTASLQYSNTLPSSINVPLSDETRQKIRFLRRDKLDNEIKKLLDFTKDSSYGIGFVDLGNTVYSDYSDSKYYLCGNIENQVENAVKQIRECGHKISFKSANSYAAAKADSITDVPLYNGNYNIIDRSIPFYQAVFRGSVNLYSTPQNLESDEKSALLKAVEYGTYPSFTVFYKYKDEIVDSNSNELYASQYISVKDKIIDAVKKTKDIYEAIGTANMISHEKDGNLAITKYDNNVTVLINYGGKPIDVLGTTVNSNDIAVIS